MKIPISSFLRITLTAFLLISFTGCHQKTGSQPANNDDAARLAAFRQQQQSTAAQAEHDAEMNRKVEAAKKRSRSFNTGGSKTWQTYIP